jgi:Arylsulfotransferase (ASST)
MFSYRKLKSAIFLSEAAILVLASFASVLAIKTVSAQGFVVPVQIQTYGNAWDGEIAFGLWKYTAPSGGSVSNAYLVVMKTDGTLEYLRESPIADYSYLDVKNIGQDTLMFQGEPGSQDAYFEATHFWNYTSNTLVDFPNVFGHHEVEYNPINNTFLNLRSYVRTVGNNQVLYDMIVEEDVNGTVLWSWDTYNYIPLSQADPFNITKVFNGQLTVDLTHSNAIQWDYNNSVVYLNVRHTNTFYKINMTSGTVIWSCGQFGSLSLLDENGKNVTSLWYHSHATRMVEPNVFTMFDNDFDNVTNPNNCHSRIIEVTVNEQNMTASVTWSWQAPTQYWSPYWGKHDRLPNGDHIGVFGSPTHQFTQNQPWVGNDTGAVLVEVNQQGNIVRTYTFPPGWGIYRVCEITNHSSVPLIPEIDGFILVLLLLSVTPFILLKRNLVKQK